MSSVSHKLLLLHLPTYTSICAHILCPSLVDVCVCDMYMTYVYMYVDTYTDTSGSQGVI